MTKIKASAFALLILLICSALPTILFANGQGNKTVEENIVILAEKAGNRIQLLITSIYSDENFTTKIENASLTEQFESNVTLYQTEGLDKLSTAQEALTNYEYNNAADSALEALAIFRQVYISLQQILETADVQIEVSTSNQELTDAITRELQRTEALKDLLSEDTPQEIINLLDNSNSTLLQAQAALQENKENEAKSLYLEAKQDLSQVYQYLKETAEESNIWRLTNFCEGLQERARERFRYGREQNVDLTATLAALGYQSETEYMNALSNQIQNAQNQQDIQNIITECQKLSQIVQEMENAVNQEINRQHGQQGGSENGGNGAGNGSGNGSGSGGNGGGSS